MISYCLLLLFLGSSLAQEPKLPNHVIPLYGNTSLGYYYANIYVGSPPQQQSVIVDTGSGQLALPCSKCVSCGKSHIQPPFQLSQSRTSRIVTCNSQEEMCRTSCHGKKESDPCMFSISYAEGSSLSGIIIEDDIQFQSASQGESIKTAFGCTTRQTNLFFTQAANGIFGLAPVRQSKLFQKLHAKHSPFTGQRLLFSLCLGKNGGQLVVGKLRSDIHKNNESVKTAFTNNRNLYSLQGVGEIRMAGSVIKQRNENPGYYGVFIDSGSTFSYLPRKNYQQLLEITQKICNQNSLQCKVDRMKSNCFIISPQSTTTILKTISKLFKPLEIQINNRVVLWNPSQYFYLKSLKKKEVCFGVQSLDRFILGGNWMVNKDIAFNLKDNTVQIFSDADCQKGVQLPTQQQNIQQEMPLYGMDSSDTEFSILDSVFSKGNNFVETLVILLFVIGVIIVMLVSVGKNFGNKSPPKIQVQHDYQNVQTTSISERKMQTIESGEQLPQDKIQVLYPIQENEQ